MRSGDCLRLPTPGRGVDHSYLGNTYGLVQFYGQDIDRLCVAMCRVQCMVLGLNGYPTRLLRAAAGMGDPAYDNPQAEALLVEKRMGARDSLAPLLALVEAEASLALVEG